jgi:RNA polymerase sigma-70 factor (ECF subfamily)
MIDTAESFEMYRPLLFSIAYRMLGSAMEAEDMVQETFLRYNSARQADIRSLKPFLTAIITRLCLDQLKSARVQRETYIGEWLPEPVLEGTAALMVNPAGRMSDYESISLAFLVLLENLTPVERAVFLLREVFDYEYDEIASIVDKEPANCRKLYSRAKKHLTAHRSLTVPRPSNNPPDAHRRISERFVQALANGKVELFTDLLAEDVIMWADGGGKASAARHAQIGRQAVARLLAGLHKLAPEGVQVELVTVNGSAGLRYFSGDQVFGITALDIGADGRIYAIRNILNPDKLRHLQHV